MHSGAASAVDAVYCRLCLQREVDELVSLYCHCATQKPQRLIADMITSLTQLPPYNEAQDTRQGLSQFICDQCLSKLDQACTFQSDYRNAVHKFNGEILQNGFIEDEFACRACDGNEINEVVSIFSACEDADDKLVADLLAEINDVKKATEEDGLPQNICTECFCSLLEAYQFRSTILENYSFRQEEQESDDAMDAHDYLQRAEEGWSVPTKKRKQIIDGATSSSSSMVVTSDDVDRFIYFDVPNSKSESLKNWFNVVDKTEFYDQLLFKGVICCCGQLFTNGDELKRHRRLQHAKREPTTSSLKCSDCRKCFNSKLNLNLHRKEPEQKYFYRCKICNVVTKERQFLEIHFESTRFHPILDSSEENRKHFDTIISTTYEPDGRCCGCDEVFKDSTSLLAHSKRVHHAECESNPMFLCTLCYTSFSNGQFLQEHQQAFAGTRKYSCREPECSFESDDRAVIRKHVESGLHCTAATFEKAMMEEQQQQTSAQEFFCCFRDCKEVLPTMFDLEQHALSDHMEKRITNRHFSKDASGNVCKLCQRHFVTDDRFKKHKRSIVVRNHACSQCPLKLSTREGLIRHEKTHQTETSKEMVVYPCPKCGVTLANPYTLRQHIFRIHDQAVADVCRFCGKQFRCKSGRKAHEMNTHMKVRPYKCHLCTRAFGSKTLLRKHIATHSDNRPYQCSYCDKSYRHQVDQRRHEQSIHLDDKRFACEVCDARFIRDRDLRLHMTSHTRVKLFACKEPGCGYSTNLARQLTEHSNEAH